MDEPGRIIVLNGAPRSGKSTIAEAIQETLDGVWMNLGVDLFAGRATPARYRPGIGLRPGGERPDLEPFVVKAYAAMYESVAAHSRAGLDVVVDVGHHDSYSAPRAILRDCARRLDGLPVLLVGVRCPIDVIMGRRRACRDGRYLAGPPGGPIPEPVLRWQREVHEPGIYDLEVDTSAMRPEQCVDEIRRCLRASPRPSAMERLIGASGREGPGRIGAD